MYIINVMAVTAAKPKKVEFDQDSKIQALWKRVCQIMCNIEAKEETEDALRIGWMVSNMSFEEEHHSGGIQEGKHHAEVAQTRAKAVCLDL